MATAWHINLDYRQVVVSIRSDYRCGILVVLDLYLELARVLHDVKVGQYVSAFVDDRARPRSFRRIRAKEILLISMIGDVHHTRTVGAIDVDVVLFVRCHARISSGSRLNRYCSMFERTLRASDDYAGKQS